MKLTLEDHFIIEAFRKKKKEKKKPVECIPQSAGSALMRGKKESVRRVNLWEASSVSADIQAPSSEGRVQEGGRVKVILLTEGLGNRGDMNYYGPEAVQSMPEAFEGAVMMRDHLSMSDERNRPEGDIDKTVGYYKNLRVESVDTPEGPKMGCVGEAHFDLTPEGEAAYKKALTAIHYSQEFPGNGKDYVGLSVNASGESERRRMTIDGEECEVNYVLKFVEARSCDMVTIPARGGKFVALVESIAGARMQNKEVRTMIVKQLEAAKKALKEAQSEKNPDLRRKKISEAQKVLDSLLKEVHEAAGRKKAKESEAEEDAEESNAEEAEDTEEAEAEAEEDGMDGGDGDEDTAGGDSHTVTTHKVVKKTGKAATAKGEESKRNTEAHRFAVKALIQESGLSPKHFDMTELSGMSFEEAKKEVARTKRVSESISEKILKSIGSDVAAGHVVKDLSESGDGSEGSANDAEFADMTV